MEKIGVLLVSYGAREVAMADALLRSENQKVDLYVVDKQRNPFNVRHAVKHVVVPGLGVEDICRFAEANRDELDFVLVGAEKPIIDGVRDLIEERVGIPVVCPKKAYAIEGSKVAQRLLFEEIAPEANPRFKIFDPAEFKSEGEVRAAVYGWLDELGDQAVVKPDKPALGKGVGVWGDHFSTREELFEHFFSSFRYNSVLIEEKIDGEESSCMGFCDGRNFVALPDTRDYKRAFNGDKGPNTGGMGSYKDAADWLPFLTCGDREAELALANRVFSGWKARISDDTALRGVPLYLAFMHTGRGIKILEINSRPGDPEIMNLLAILKDDFVDVCLRMVEGDLKRVAVEKLATVLTYKVPPDYGGYASVHPGAVDCSVVGGPVDLSRAEELCGKYGGRIRVYPGSMEVRDGGNYALKSRAVGVLGVGETIEEAREISLEGAKAISGGGLWNRTDVAAKGHIAKSIRHMEKLRAAF